MVTGTIATYFQGKKESITYRDKTIDSIQMKLDNLDNLSDEDINQMAEVLKSLRK